MVCCWGWRGKVSACLHILPHCILESADGRCPGAGCGGWMKAFGKESEHPGLCALRAGDFCLGAE